MKKLFFSVLFAGLFAISANAIDSDKYIVLGENAQIKDAKNSVIEVFSYACIHCFNHHLNGTLASVAKDNAGTSFEIWQVEQMGQNGEQMMKILAYAKALDAKNNKNILDEQSATQKVIAAYFEATFKLKMTFKDSAQFYSIAVNIFKDLGQNVSANDIENYALSDAGKAYISRANAGLEVAKLVGTPAFVVNGKYVLRNENMDSIDDMKKSIKELLAM